MRGLLRQGTFQIGTSVMRGMLRAATVTSGLSLVAPWAAGATPTVRVADVHFTPDGDLKLTIRVADLPGPGLGAVTVDLLYDPAVFHPRDCEADSDSRFDTALCNAWFDADGTGPDVVRVTAVSVSGQEGSFPLATVGFQAVAPQTSIRFDLVLRTFVDPAGSPVPVSVAGAMVTLDDGQVDIQPLPARGPEVQGIQRGTPTRVPGLTPETGVLPATPVGPFDGAPTEPLPSDTAAETESGAGRAATGAPGAGTGAATGGSFVSARWVAGLSALGVAALGSALAAVAHHLGKSARKASGK